MENLKAKRDNVIPTSKWSFSKEVTDCFGDMLNRSIPDYKAMRSLTEMLGFSFVKKGYDIVDLGCSNGLSAEPFIKQFGEHNRFFMFDKSAPMIEECRRKYKEYIDKDIAVIENYDICYGLPYVRACLVLSVLTIQFTPIEYRQKILNDVYNTLEEGGAFIFVEKVLGDTYETNQLMVEKYYDIKRNNGYTQEQIDSKRKSLEGVLVPLTSEANETMLRKAGFKQVDRFWQCLNFVGWIAIK